MDIVCLSDTRWSNIRPSSASSCGTRNLFSDTDIPLIVRNRTDYRLYMHAFIITNLKYAIHIMSLDGNKALLSIVVLIAHNSLSEV